MMPPTEITGIFGITVEGSSCAYFSVHLKGLFDKLFPMMTDDILLTFYYA